MTAFGTMETAIGAIRAGAYDFVIKPLNLDDMAVTIERTVGHRRLREEVKQLRKVVRDVQRGEMIGSSPCLAARRRRALLGKRSHALGALQQTPSRSPACGS